VNGAFPRGDESDDDGEEEEEGEDGETDEFLGGVGRKEKGDVRRLPVDGGEEIADATAETHHERVGVEGLIVLVSGGADVAQQRLARTQTDLAGKVEKNDAEAEQGGGGADGKRPTRRR